MHKNLYNTEIKDNATGKMDKTLRLLISQTFSPTVPSLLSWYIFHSTTNMEEQINTE